VCITVTKISEIANLNPTSKPKPQTLNLTR